MRREKIRKHDLREKKSSSFLTDDDSALTAMSLFSSLCIFHFKLFDTHMHINANQ